MNDKLKLPKEIHRAISNFIQTTEFKQFREISKEQTYYFSSQFITDGALLIDVWIEAKTLGYDTVCYICLTNDDKIFECGFYSGWMPLAIRHYFMLVENSQEYYWGDVTQGYRGFDWVELGNLTYLPQLDSNAFLFKSIDGKSWVCLDNLKYLNINPKEIDCLVSQMIGMECKGKFNLHLTKSVIFDVKYKDIYISILSECYKMLDDDNWLDDAI